jgi:C-terminal processing protease CtpA/Prc
MFGGDFTSHSGTFPRFGANTIMDMNRVAAIAFALLALSQAARAQTPDPSPVSLAPVQAGEVEAVVAAAIAELGKAYVYPEVATRMGKDLRTRLKAGEYATADARELARTLTRDLQAVSRDKHVRVVLAAEHSARMHKMAAPAGNHGIGKHEILAGNIGYLEVTSFLGRGPGVEEAIARAMTALAGTDALIVDVRANGGGNPQTVARLSSYLFERPTHLNSLYWRERDRTDEFWTEAEVDGKRFGEGKPVYVLTSPKTFSGAEEFSYNLKNLKRATIVGERTGGGAHPGAVRKLNDRFAIFVPTGRAVSPVTGTNWEGTGVIPDVEVPAAEALERALELARGTRAGRA